MARSVARKPLPVLAGWRTVGPIGWLLVGVLVLVAILAIGLRINARKSTAHLAVRLAEAYRLEGDFATAQRLYDVAPALHQNVQPAAEGHRRAREGVREPVIERPLVEAARRRLVEEREAVQAHLREEGIQIELPPIAVTQEPEASTEDSPEDRRGGDG